MIPEEIRVPIKTCSPKWSLHWADVTAPGLFFLSSFAVIAVDQLLRVLTNGEEPSWTAIVAIPLLMVLKKFLTEGSSQTEEPKK